MSEEFENVVSMIVYSDRELKKTAKLPSWAKSRKAERAIRHLTSFAIEANRFERLNETNSRLNREEYLNGVKG